MRNDRIAAVPDDRFQEPALHALHENAIAERCSLVPELRVIGDTQNHAAALRLVLFQALHRHRVGERMREAGRLGDLPWRHRNAERREGMARALEYMGLTPNVPIGDVRIDKVFIGSCTNSRIEDLREAASVARGRRVASNVRLAMVVPGSGLVKAQAEAEGLDRTFRDAGFEWREPGCSMCLAMNDDRLEPGERCASTSNRNFEGRQGAGGRTHLVSPAMAAAAAIAGHFVDVRRLSP